MMRVMGSGKFHMATEADEEEYRKELKENGEAVARLKGKVAKEGVAAAVAEADVTNLFQGPCIVPTWQ